MGTTAELERNQVAVVLGYETAIDLEVGNAGPAGDEVPMELVGAVAGGEPLPGQTRPDVVDSSFAAALGAPTQVVTLEPLGRDDEASRGELQSTELRVKQDLARELHDRVAQTLTTMLVEMENFKAGELGSERVVAEVTYYQDATREVLGNIRAILHELRGDEDVGHDLPDRVRRLLDRFQAQTGILTRLSVAPRWPVRMAIMAAINLYRMLVEALNNVRLHSGAKLVEISFQITDGDLAVVSVIDDGQGFRGGLADEMGLGMLGMRERALLLGGDLSITPIPSRGTELAVVIPKDKLI
ncbi:MAG: sensor histidine kinase [Candidatus Dormibacter sp.]|uniref:sensor histidine kinase n=1 Tax=Candidatus Dormibacter sp. TaxID=2973982 RepID=UPI000DB8308E|nr:MAG: hypothetical protein DLM66_14325 [Candidatus Dormibacteraeota bacterium]